MSQKIVITISRQYGSGGRLIGQMLAKELNIPFYDKELIAVASKESGIAQGIFEKADEQASNSLMYTLSMGMFPTAVGSSFSNMPMNDRVFLIQSDIIRRFASEGSCVIVGRCADYVLRNDPNAVNVFIHSDQESRIKRAIDSYQIPADKARAFVVKTDKRRATYHDYYTGVKWGRAENYHLCIYSDFIGLEGAVQTIRAFAECHLAKQQ